MTEKTLNWNDILTLVETLDQRELESFHLEQPGLKITISRHENTSSSAGPQPTQPSHSVPSVTTSEPVATPDTPSSHTTSLSTTATIIDSPMIGVFYAAPSPGEDPFISVGDQVTEETTVGIIEVMKLMNPVAAKVSGKILRVLVENGEQVQFGQPLFEVEDS